MAEIFPFRAYRYNPDRVPLQQVLTQPYDKITPEMQQRYYAAHPCNFIRVEKGLPEVGDTDEENVYTRAARTLDQWIAEGILAQDAEPAFYPYTQEYMVPGTRQRRLRRGFLGLGRLEDYSARVVFRHERTFPGPKADRLELLRHTRMQTGLLFMLYRDPERQTDRLLAEVTAAEPEVEVTDEYGVVHRLWQLSDPGRQQLLQQALAPSPLIIADGHHRYETALAFRDEQRQRAGRLDPSAPYEKALMAFFNLYGEGLTILPTHRLVYQADGFSFEAFRRRLEPYFDWYAYPFGSDEEERAALGEFQRDLERTGSRRRVLGVYAGTGAFYLFVLRREADLGRLLSDVSPLQRQLDVVLVHRLLLEKGLGIAADEHRIGYERELARAIEAVDRGQARLAVLLNPVRIEQVEQIALAGEVLPEKSTDFYPKLLSGLALYRLERASG